MKPLVIYHANCTDGFAAAYAAWLKLGDAAEYLPMQYGNAFNGDVRQRDVYILDFSFNREQMDWLFENAQRVVWLDHHKTAFEMWCGGIPDGGVYREHIGNHFVELNNHRSGALITWRYFFPEMLDSDIPPAFKLIDDRDRWQFKLEGSKEFHAALGAYQPWSFEQWRGTLDITDPVSVEQMIDEGWAILKAQDNNVQWMATQSRKCRIDSPMGSVGFDGLAVNAPLHMSELGHELANRSGAYGMIWYLGADNNVKVSLRSNGDYDVSAIAKMFGGGGHKNAAGFQTDIQTLMGWLA